MLRIIAISVVIGLYAVITIVNYWADVNTKPKASWIQAMAWPLHVLRLSCWAVVSLATHRWKNQGK